MYILFVYHVLFLSSDHLKLSIKHSFASSGIRLLYFASACFLPLPLAFFHFCSIFFYSLLLYHYVIVFKLRN